MRVAAALDRWTPLSPRQTKAALVLGLLHGDGGAMLAQLATAHDAGSTDRAAQEGQRYHAHSTRGNFA